jgi:peptide/nickel transport system substrate-binding protein
MLEGAGWRDVDGDGLREAQDVPGMAAGTVFSVTLLTTQGDAARERAAEVLKENLSACGVGVSVNYLEPDIFYADGPDGPVFGRQFDLALFSWLNGLGAPCELYLSTHIPSEDNWWATSNNPDYASEEYDRACRSAIGSLYGTENHVNFHKEAQRIFSRDVPVLPLYFVPRVIAARSTVTGLALDPSQRTAFWNIESVDVMR